MFLKLVMGVVVSILWASSGWAISLVDADWLKANLSKKDVRIVDVAEKPDTYFVKGHIPGAVYINRYVELGDLNANPSTLFPTKKQFEELMSKLGISKNTTVVAYDDTFGLFASRFLVIMELYGHDIKKLKLLNGGIVKWKSLGYETATDYVSVNPVQYMVNNAQIRKDLRLSKADVFRDVVNGMKPDVMLIDSRPEPEFLGKKIRSVRGGAIARAINITGTVANDPKDHTFKPVEEIKKTYEQRGVTPDKEIYAYCHSGDRSAHTYITLKYLLGYKRVKFYDGSWIEWSMDLSLPPYAVAGQVWPWDEKKEAKKEEPIKQEPTTQEPIK